MHFQSLHFKFRYFANHHFVRKYIFTYISSGCFIITGDYIKNIDGHFVNISDQCSKDEKLKFLNEYYETLNKLKNVSNFISTNEFTYNSSYLQLDEINSAARNIVSQKAMPIHPTNEESICGLTDEEIKKYKNYGEMINKLNKLKKTIPINK